MLASAQGVRRRGPGRIHRRSIWKRCERSRSGRTGVCAPGAAAASRAGTGLSQTGHRIARTGAVRRQRCSSSSPLMTATSRPRSRARVAPGVSRSSSTACARNATTAWAISAIWAPAGFLRGGGRQHGVAQPAACAVSGCPGARQPLQPVEPMPGSITLYLDVEAIADFAECEEARALVLAPQTQAQLRALRAAEQVDYRGVAEMKARCSSACIGISAAPTWPGTPSGRGLFARSSPSTATACASRRCSRRCRSTFARRTARYGAGPHGRKPGGTRDAPEVAHSARIISSVWNTSNTCNGRRPHSWQLVGARSQELGLGVG